MIVIVGLSHRTAPIEVRERYALAEDAQEALAKSVMDGGRADGAMVLSTCNRTEIILSFGGPPPDGDSIQRLLMREASEATPDDIGVFYRYEGEAALLHLFRVAASLDSLVVGEPQILGQLKDAQRRAEKAMASGMIVGGHVVRIMADEAAGDYGDPEFLGVYGKVPETD